ncbi:MAG: MmcQ/YjbR family DNA-binding protein [Thermomicrobiales bacterium]
MPKPTDARIDPTVIDRLRSLCAAFPGAVEDAESVGKPVFKVGGKIFAIQHGADNRMSLWVKAPAGMQSTIVASDDAFWFVPPYVGHRGWVGCWLDGTPDWDTIADAIDESYRLTAPKRLLRELDASSTP